MRSENGTSKAIDLPYDVTGWTLSLQMGVDVDAVTDPMRAGAAGAADKIDSDQLPEASVEGAGAMFAVSHKVNASFELVNAALAQGGSVSLAQDPVKTSEGWRRARF